MSAGFVSANQCNSADAGTLGPAGSLTVSMTNFGVPATASAVVLNVTATDTTGTSYLTVWPATATRPTASNLNWVAGQTVPNLVEVALVNSQASVYNNQGSVDVVIDLEGYVDTASPNLYNAVNPQRICDTRAAGTGVASNQCESSNGGAGTLSSGGQKIVTVAGMAGVPSDATAVIVNLTVTGPGAAGYFTVWPDGATKPLASNLNWLVGQSQPNRVVVGLGSGKFDIFLGSDAPADVVVDVNGYFSTAAGGAGYIGASPVRVCDTRPVGPGVAANTCNDPNNGGPGPLQPGDQLLLVPPAATAALAMNVTATDTTGDSFLTVFPDPASTQMQPPLTSDLNWSPGVVAANFVVVSSAGSAPGIVFYNNVGTVNLVVDLEGVYSTTPISVAAAQAPTVILKRRR